MAVYTVRLAAASSVGGTLVTIFTAPTGKTTVIRDIRWANESGSTGSAQLGISSGNVLDISPSMASGTTSGHECRIVLEAGESLYLFSSLSSFQLTLTGYSLS